MPSSATVTSSTDTRDLKSYLESLPQELFDEIWTMTFTLDSQSATHIKHDYKTPAILQVNQATRSALLKDYYSTRIFVGSFVDIRHWVFSLTPAIVGMVTQIRVYMVAGSQSPIWAEYVAQLESISDMSSAMGVDYNLGSKQAPYPRALNITAWNHSHNFSLFSDEMFEGLRSGGVNFLEGGR